MNIDTLVTTACLVALAIFHSALGEAKLVGPLLRAPLPVLPLGASFARRTLRLAWHLTSVAWVALAVSLWVAPTTAWVVGVLLLLSGAATLIGVRGRHFAWALFVTGGLSALHRYQTGATPAWLAWAGASVAAAIGALHVGWALGLRWGRDAVIPQRDGRPTFRPGRGATLLVAGALAGLAAVFLALGGVVTLPGASILALVAALVFAARTVGDFRHVGLFRRPTTDAFARNDAALYTPLCFALAAALVWLR